MSVPGIVIERVEQARIYWPPVPWICTFVIFWQDGKGVHLTVLSLQMHGSMTLLFQKAIISWQMQDSHLAGSYWYHTVVYGITCVSGLQLGSGMLFIHVSTKDPQRMLTLPN
jgi:hypothetical protein